MPKVSIARAARKAVTADAKLRGKKSFATTDSFQNFAAGLGLGTDSLPSAGTYGFNPITRNRTLLEWIHRGSWLGGIAVDVVADDMTRAGVDIRGDVDPDDIEHLERAATTYNIWNEIADTVRWSRLYGGCICAMLIDGQNMATPLRLDTVGKGQFKGLLTLDRWQIEPSLNDLVTDPGPYMGLPKFYDVIGDAPALRGKRIHYSRCIRLEGIRLSYWQRMMENLWGISVLERLYDRMMAFDSATTGVANLVYKAYLRVYKIAGMRQAIAAGGPTEGNLIKFVELMRRFQSIEGITLIDAEDDLAAMAQPSFTGLSEALIQLGQQVSGALQIPMVRLFGQSPVGMNATGESDLRMYYDLIKQRQKKDLDVPVTNIYRALAQSEGIKLSEGFSIEFRSLWVLSDDQKASIATADANAVVGVFNAGIVSPRVALSELRQLSKTTGRFTNITDKDIKAASAQTGAQLNEAMGAEQLDQLQNPPEEDDAPPPKAKKKSKDAMLGSLRTDGFEVVVEHEAGELRYGVALPASYGYIRGTDSAEPDNNMDCFLGTAGAAKDVYVIDAYKVNGKFDEHKVMLAYNDAPSALLDFDSYYGKLDRPMTGIITAVPKAEFQTWLKSGDLTAPFAATMGVA